MKNKNYFVWIALLAFMFSVGATAQNTAKGRYTPRESNKKSATAGFYGALDYYATIRNNQITGTLDYADYSSARKAVDQMGGNKDGNLTWNNIGPTNQGGRVRSILFDRSDSDIMYVGSVSGGLWKTTNGGQSWFTVNDLQESLTVSCIAQGSNGIVYYGTGEGFAPGFGSTAGSTGFLGTGLYKSTDATGSEFVHVASTDPDTDDSWDYIYEIAIHPTNGNIYAATKKGIKMSSDGGSTWSNPLVAFSGTGTSKAYDVDISPNGNVISCIVANKLYLSNDGGSTWENQSTGATGKLPSSGISRIEADIAQSNPSYIYACAAKSTTDGLLNIYRTTDGGATWAIIGPGGSENFNPLGTQGTYDNVIKVHPTNPNKVFVGGLDMWSWEQGGNWEQRSLWNLSEESMYYLHADHHEYVFHPDNPNVIYFGTDGGVSKSIDGGLSFERVNRNFVSLQYYAIAIGPKGEIMGGTQDNGTLLMDRIGYVEGRSVPLLGGDGGYCSFSYLNPKLYFASIYYGDVYRTPTGVADGMATFYDDFVTAFSPGTTSFASFVTPLVLHEKIDDYLSPDSTKFTALEEYEAGDTVTVFSKTSVYPFQYILPVAMNIDDTLMVHDIITSKFYVGGTGRVFMTRGAHNFASQPAWYQIASISGTTQCMSVSKCGNYLFLGTTGGNLYRISNLAYANDSLSSFYNSTYSAIEVKKLTLSISGRSVNNIAIDPNDPSRIVVALGNYGNTYYLYYSNNALDETPTFAQKQGNLPRFPVYSALIDITNPNTVLVGTEFGIFMTENITAASPIWTEENDGGIARVPVYDLKQQIYMFPGVTNFGAVYAGTHGRGAFECLNFVSVPDQSNISENSSLHVYPNPARDQISISLDTKINASSIQILNIDGKLVKQVNVPVGTIGDFTIDIANLPAGVYMINLTGENLKLSGKFIKIK